MKIHNPATSAAPNGPYSLGVEVPAGQRVLFVAGQVPVAKDGSTPQGIKAQAEQVWRNIIAVLESAGMGVENLVKVNHYLTKAENIPGYGEVRSKMLGAARPASTMVVVQSLVKPEWLVEVEAYAAK
ncbi:MAG TPA: RidA family protein [Steroidobacteraceae bacterium]|nr:RidA family protein [Steroidobacteraceae bacterium]